MEKAIFGVAAILIGFFGYLPYFQQLFSGKIKPHAFSWLIWSLLAAITFSAQITRGAGPGAWISAFWFLSCFIIFIFGIKKGEKNIVFIDWLSLIVAFLSLFLWYFTSTPLYTVIIITCIDIIAFIPTIRKSYQAPDEENATLYFCSSVSYVFSLFAMQEYSIITLFNPIVLIPINALFGCFLLLRRKACNQF